MSNQVLATDSRESGSVDLTERKLGNVALPHAACGAWSFTTVGAVVEHVSYQSVSETSGTIAPVFGMSLSGRGTGGGYVSGGGGAIWSQTKEWCRLVARRGDGRTFSTQGGCELALHDGSQLFVAHAQIAGNEREFLLFNPDSGISQLKVTADQLTTVKEPSPKMMLCYLGALLCFYNWSHLAGLGVILTVIPSVHLYFCWQSARKYRATRAQIDESISLVQSDFRSRLSYS